MDKHGMLACAAIVAGVVVIALMLWQYEPSIVDYKLHTEGPGGIVRGSRRMVGSSKTREVNKGAHSAEYPLTRAL